MSVRRGSGPRLGVVSGLVVLLLAGPILAGLVGTVAPALGWFPVLGRSEISLSVFADLLSQQVFWPALMLSITTGLIATLVSVILVILMTAAWHGTRAFALVERALSPLLAIPHAAAAFGLAFLIAPSGWLVRWMSPSLTGWAQPPDILIVNDPTGMALIAGLVVKEVPFLFLMTVAALGQVEGAKSRAVAGALGYGQTVGWLKSVFPRVYPQIRLPIYAVLAYSLTTVDVALILGPTRPNTLAVEVLRWMNDPDLALRFRAAAGAVVLLAVVGGALCLWRLGERAGGHIGRRWVMGGRRAADDFVARIAIFGLVAVCVLAVGAGLLGLAVWSVAARWPFPDALPGDLTMRTWARALPSLASLMMTTAIIAALSVIAALCLTLGHLEARQRIGSAGAGRPGSDRLIWLIYLPLIVPQIAFLPGLQMLSLIAGLDGGLVVVILGHILFVLPYVFLALMPTWYALDPRFAVIGGALGAGAGKVFWRIRLPMLLQPVLTAAAIGVAVSVGQYLPTLLLGGGRIETLTTDAVALASGGNRRLIGVYGLMQMIAALAPFAVALFLPRLIWRNRRGMQP